MPAGKEAHHETIVVEPICVITPCFNAAPFLLSCLRSVLAQGRDVHKHIVMDGGSNDASVAILRSFSDANPNLCWRSEPDRGQSDALNKALNMVDTRYFAWLNADDCYLPGKVRNLILATESAARPAIVYGDYQIIDANGDVLKHRQQPSFNYWDCLYSYLTVQNCAAIFDTDICRATGGFDSNLEFCMDYDLILRLASKAPVRHVREYVGCFRHHEEAKTSRLQDVCVAETKQLRLKFSGRSAAELRWRYWISTMRVATRMVVEDCIKSRINISRIAGNVSP
jgi:glycosyltransferase involved in cell wall biosynthesis